MGTLSKPNTFSANGTIRASEVNDNFDTLYNGVNGNLDANNLATGAVTTAKIADSNVTTAKIADSNVTTGKLADSAITTAKLNNGAVTADKLGTGVQAASVATSESTTGTSYTDLSTVGPSVTVTVGANGIAHLSFSAQQSNSAGTAVTYTGFVASGANTIAATDNDSIIFVSPANGNAIACSLVKTITGLTPGSTTFKLQYRCNGSVGSWLNRKISVIPL